LAEITLPKRRASGWRRWRSGHRALSGITDRGRDAYDGEGVPSHVIFDPSQLVLVILVIMRSLLDFESLRSLRDFREEG
jgi:hypothetical protein